MSSDEDSSSPRREKFKNERVDDVISIIGPLPAGEQLGPKLSPHVKRRFSSEMEGSIQKGPRESFSKIQGPKLPPHIKLKESSPDVEGPVLPPHIISRPSLEFQGPKLPPHINPRESSPEIEGPILPPHLNPKESFSKIEGPILPPHIKPRTSQEFSGPKLPPHINQRESSPEVEGPILPPHLNPKESFPKIEGPILPPHIKPRGLSPVDVEGPMLPPHLKMKSEPETMGPQLPPGLKELPEITNIPEEDSDDDTSGIGPNLNLMSSGHNRNKSIIDDRAEKARRKMLGLDIPAKPTRESWMLELPPEKAANLGLGPRQFRSKPPLELGDRSVWTDTPEDTARKEINNPEKDKSDDLRKETLKRRDKEMEKIAKKAEKRLKRNESLLSIHTKKIAKEKKTNDETVRKRFNRETDMQVNRFDEAQKRSIVKKAQLLNDRFSSGESKFL